MSPPQQSRSLVSGFLRSLLANPGSPALELGELSLSYEQLWNYAGRITACLDDTLDPSEKVVAVLANRSIAAYGGILGVLASGRGYVPLNPKFPLERTLVMLKASGCKTLVVGQECAATLESLLPRVNTPLTLIIPDSPDSGWEPKSISSHRVISAHRLSRIADPCEPVVDGKRYSVSALYFGQHRSAQRSGRQPIECRRLHGISQRSVLACMAEIVARRTSI